MMLRVVGMTRDLPGWSKEMKKISLVASLHVTGNDCGMIAEVSWNIGELVAIRVAHQLFLGLRVKINELGQHHQRFRTRAELLRRSGLASLVDLRVTSSVTVLRGEDRVVHLTFNRQHELEIGHSGQLALPRPENQHEPMWFRGEQQHQKPTWK